MFSELCVTRVFEFLRALVRLVTRVPRSTPSSPDKSAAPKPAPAKPKPYRPLKRCKSAAAGLVSACCRLYAYMHMLKVILVQPLIGHAIHLHVLLFSNHLLGMPLIACSAVLVQLFTKYVAMLSCRHPLRKASSGLHLQYLLPVA